MIHKDRVFKAPPATIEELVCDLQRSKSWTLCSGWRIGDTLFLNDSFTEDSALELAVLRVQPDGKIFQIESVTFGWMNDDEIADMVKTMTELQLEDAPIRVPIAIRLDHGDTPCDLCR